MPRLIDDMRIRQQFQMPWFVVPEHEASWSKHSLRIAELLMDPDLPIIRIDNVAEYYFAGTDQENWDLSKDFPNLAPPFDRVWFEYRVPKLIRSREHGDSDLSANMPHGRAGILMLAATRENVVGENIPDNMRWALIWEVFLDYGDSAPPQGPHGTITLAIDAEGCLIDSPLLMVDCAPDLAVFLNSYTSWIHPACLAISFMHCRNVKIVDEQVDKPLAKKWHQKTGHWPAPYKTLVIEPLKQILRHEGGSHKHGLAKAMHICRGHFKDYRQGPGLFGKYRQLVWQPSIVRGSKGQHAAAREIEVKL